MAENGEKITYFGETDARGKRVRFGIKAKDRTKHMYVIGKTGMGKSTLLENLAIQDIQNGEGLAFVDPHGGSAEKLLDYIPEERIKDVLYFAPFDLENPISFNILEDIGADKRHLVVNGLMSTFEKIWVDAWSARMSYILQNTIQALLEYPDSTLLGVNRVLVDKEYRKKVVDNVTDPAVKAFWTEEFAKYTDRYTQEATPAIQNKIGQFVSNPLIRNVIGQPNSAFDIREIMDKKKILIVNLSKGKVGEGNANLLGGMLITRIYLAAMSRADATEQELEKLPSFNLYVDEFQSFANKTFENILSEARKYKLNLTIAHQYIEQMEEEVRNAVFGNVGTMITFRVGAYDAEVLEKEFAPTFYADNLVNLGVFQIYLKLMIDGVSSAPFSATTMLPIERPKISFKEQVLTWSREKYGTPRAKVEEDIKKWHKTAFGPAREERRTTHSVQNINRPTSTRLPERSSQSGAPQTDRPAFVRSPQKQNTSYQERPAWSGPQQKEEQRQSATPARTNTSHNTPTTKEPYKRDPEGFTGNRDTISLSELKTQTKTHIHKRFDGPARQNNPYRKPDQNRDQNRDKSINTDKEPTQEHRKELKAALAGIIKTEEKTTPQSSKPSLSDENKNKKPKHTTPDTHSEKIPPKKEIPENELRKMLDV